MESREKAIFKLRKIKLLALEGVGGERTGAQKMYEDLKRKYQITEAEIEETLSEPKGQQLSFAMAVLQQQIHEEHLCCNECPEQCESDFCHTSCGTYGNIKDLETQWEHLAAEMEGRQYAE